MAGCIPGADYGSLDFPACRQAGLLNLAPVPMPIGMSIQKVENETLLQCQIVTDKIRMFNSQLAHL
jgi:hypothetical protein